MRKLAYLLILMVLGCGTTTQTTGGVSSGKQITPSSKILVVGFPDAVDKGGSTIGGSGGAATAAIRDALLKRGYSPIVGDSHTLAEAFTEAQKLSSVYVLRGSLIGWEDNATGWSARPDTAGLSLELYDSSSRELVGSASNTAKSSAIEFVPGAPDRLLPEITTATLNKLFGLHI